MRTLVCFAVLLSAPVWANADADAEPKPEAGIGDGHSIGSYDDGFDNGYRIQARHGHEQTPYVVGQGIGAGFEAGVGPVFPTGFGRGIGVLDGISNQIEVDDGYGNGVGIRDGYRGSIGGIGNRIPGTIGGIGNRIPSTVGGIVGGIHGSYGVGDRLGSTISDIGYDGLGTKYSYPVLRPVTYVRPQIHQVRYRTYPVYKLKTRVHRRLHPVIGYKTEGHKRLSPVIKKFKEEIRKEVHPVKTGYKTEVHKQVHNPHATHSGDSDGSYNGSEEYHH